MANKGNKLVPILGVVAVLIVGVIVFMQFRGSNDSVKADALLRKAPSALPEAKGADQDTPSETLTTVVTSNRELRTDVQKVLEENKRLRDDITKHGIGSSKNASASTSTSTDTGTGADTRGDAGVKQQPTERSTMDVFGDAFDQAGRVTNGIIDTLPKNRSQPDTTEAVTTGTSGGATGSPPERNGAFSYRVVPPMGYTAYTPDNRGRGGPAVTTYVRTSTPGPSTQEGGAPDGTGPASRAAQAAQRGSQGALMPYFTIPENSTLAGVTSMTSLIGRVPVDGRVTDPMQFKAVVGRDNLAANGFELPDDLSGMIISGVAIGDMALSCSEGKIRSFTFVFNDGTIRTVSTRRSAFGDNRVGSGAGGGGGAGDDLGYISDQYGNPCIQGKFVTNAPSYLTDIVGVKSLEVAGQAYAEAQRTVQASGLGGVTSSVTGNAGSFALGNAVSGASDEVSKWLLSRLKNSFDAVVTPSGQQLVIHLDQEIRIDKNPNGRRLVHRTQSANLDRGARYGLE